MVDLDKRKSRLLIMEMALGGCRREFGNEDAEDHSWGTGASRLGVGRLMWLRNRPWFLEAAGSLGSPLGSEVVRAGRRN